MSDLQLYRNEAPIEGQVFLSMPYGVKKVASGEEFDFDQFHETALAETIRAAGMTPVRADSMYGTQSVMGTIWRGLQQAEIVIVDFTGRSPNVAMEFGMATLIGKKIIYLTQDVNDIPVDVRGRLRYISYTSHFADIHRLRDDLSRQLVAIRKEPSVEMALVPMASGGTDPIPARVVTVTREHIVVQTLDGAKKGVLGNADVEYERIIPDMARRFSVGDHLSGAFDIGGMKYTLLAGRTNPWPQLASDFEAGTRFTATVRRVSPTLGVFVPLAHGIDGLIHVSTLGNRRVEPGDHVEVTVTRMDTDKRRVSLALDRVLRDASGARPLVAVPSRAASGSPRVASSEPMPQVGDQVEGDVVKVCPEGAGGYILIHLPGRRRPAMLHCTQMSAALRRDLNAGEVEIGEILDVEVVTVDDAHDRVTVREVEDSTSTEAELPAAS